MSVPTLPTCTQSGRRMGPGESDSKSRSLIQKVRIHSELPIPAGCDSMSIYKSLKYTLQDAFRFSVWFDVKFEGLATQLWKFEARLNNGTTMVYRTLRSKFRALILKVFENHLSREQFSQFKSNFSRITKMLQIEEDVAPFTEDKPFSWTRDGLPDDGPAAASIPAPSIATLLPTGSGPADGSSGRVPNA